MSDKKLSTEVRKKQIAEAVLHVAAKNGLRHLSMASVAEQTGLVPSAIYRHFQNKDEMIEAVLDHVRDNLMNNTSIACEQTDDPFQQLETILFRHVSLVKQHSVLPQILLSSSAYSDNPRRKSIIWGIIQDYLQRITAIISQGQQAGIIRRDMEAASLSVSFLGLLQPPILLNHLSDGEFDVEYQVKAAWPLFRESIQSPQRTIRGKTPRCIDKP